MGMFLHFAPNTWQDREYDDGSTPLTAIDPDIDTDQWARVARDLGARYVPSRRLAVIFSDIKGETYTLPSWTERTP